MNFGIITAIFRPFLLNYCWVCILLFSFTFTGIQTEQNYYYEILLPHIVKFLIEHSTFLFKDSKNLTGSLVLELAKLSLLWFGQLYLLLYCFLPLYSVLIWFTKVVLLAFKLLSHNPFLWKERKINSIIAVIVLLVIASLVVRYLPLYHSTLPHPEWNTPCGVNLLLPYIRLSSVLPYFPRDLNILVMHFFFCSMFGWT